MAVFDNLKRVLDTAHAAKAALDNLGAATDELRRKTEEIKRVLREHEGRLSRPEGFVAGAGLRLPGPGGN